MRAEAAGGGRAGGETAGALGGAGGGVRDGALSRMVRGMPGKRGALGGLNRRSPPLARPVIGSAHRLARFQAFSSLSHQPTRPGETGIGQGNSPALCMRHAVVRLTPTSFRTSGQSRSRSSGPPGSTPSPLDRIGVIRPLGGGTGVDSARSRITPVTRRPLAASG